MQTDRNSRKGSKLQTKTCTKCGKAKHATSQYFGPDSRGLFGLRGDCRECRRKTDLANKKRREGKGLFERTTKVTIPAQDAWMLRNSPVQRAQFTAANDNREVAPAEHESLLRDYSDSQKPVPVAGKTVGPAGKFVPGAHAHDSSEIRILPSDEVQRILFIPDCHHPYHDKVKWQLLLDAAREFKPDIIVILGDFADFYAVSSHSKDPNRRRNLESEVDSVNVALDQLDSLGAKSKIFISGNHCDRLERYLMERAPELFNMVRIRDLFELDRRGWSFVPYKRHAKIGHLHMTHDTNRAGRYAHYQSQADFGGANVVIGHTHRLGYMVEGSAQGEPHVSAMFGWLGDFEQVDYMHKVRALRDWSHGFGIGYLLPSGCVHLTPIPIVSNTVVIEGKVVSIPR